MHQLGRLRAMSRRALGPLTAVASTVPALLDQSSVDATGEAWLLMAFWAAGSVAAGAFMVAHPLLATLGTFGTLAYVELTASALEAELSFLDLAPTAACLFMAGALASRRTVAAIAAVILAGTATGVLVNQVTADPDARGGLDVLAGLLTLALALAAGLVLRAQRDTTAAARQTLAVERQRHLLAEQEAMLQERARIAREMHDVVAHSVTLLVVNAETMRARRDELPPWASEQADAMAAAGRRASTEVRDLLRLLRTDDAIAETRPVPGLDQLQVLVEEARTSAPVSFDVVGEQVPVSAATGLTVYRVVQECLSNARRHSPGAAIRIGLTWSTDDLRLEVSTARSTVSASAEGTGIGLVGMRERVAECGGLLQTMSTDAGHRVTVTLPTGGRRG